MGGCNIAAHLLYLQDMGLIYKITSPTGKLYVGKTYHLKRRINAHKCASKSGKNIILHNSIRKHGWDAHVLEIIEKVEDELMNEREVYWIEHLKTYCYDHPNGMNMTKGGDGQRSPWMHKTELRKYFSDKFSGDGNPFFGKKHTEETRKLLAEKTSKYNKEHGVKVPEWGAQKGWDSVKRAVVAYNNKGEFIGEYDSLSLCGRSLGINLSGVRDSVLYSQWYNGVYKFFYKTENYPLKIEVGEIKVKTVKRPVLLMNGTFQIIKEYPSALEASLELGVPKTTINRAALNEMGMTIRTGHRFIYKDLYDKLSQK